MNLVSRLLPLNHVLLGLDVSSKKRLFERSACVRELRQIPRARSFVPFRSLELGSTGAWLLRGDSPRRTSW